MKKIIKWSRTQYKNGTLAGKILYLAYEICVNAYVQGTIHLIASCVFGAFAYKEQRVNWPFIVPFIIGYLFVISVFVCCNVHRKNRNRLLAQYECSYSKISNSILTEYRKNLELYSAGKNLSLEDLLKKYKETDFFTETCFRVCDAIKEVLQKESEKEYRVILFLRTNIDQDEYHINGFSPLSSEPEIYGKSFSLDELNAQPKKWLPAHARPFLNNRCEPLILVGQKEVRKVYRNFNDQNPTKLHIGIPIAIRGMVTMVLQITSHDDYKGTEDNIRDLIENVLNLFVAYLKVTYMHQIKHEQIAAARKRGEG